MKSPMKEILLKVLVMIIFIMASLSITNLVALIAGIRPQTVISYVIFGMVVTYISNRFIDKAILKKEEPTSEEVLEQLKIAEQEREVMKDIISDKLNITPQEIKVRAKVGDYIRREEDKEGSPRS